MCRAAFGRHEWPEDKVRVDAVGLSVLLALAVTGVITAHEAVAGFSDSSVLMIGGLFIVGQGLVATGVAEALGTWLAKVGQGSETRLIFLKPGSFEFHRTRASASVAPVPPTLTKVVKNP